MYESEVSTLREKLENDKGNDIRYVDLGSKMDGNAISFGSFYEVISE